VHDEAEAMPPNAHCSEEPPAERRWEFEDNDDPENARTATAATTASTATTAMLIRTRPTPLRLLLDDALMVRDVSRACSLLR
jgi:hypothetical protein